MNTKIHNIHSLISKNEEISNRKINIQLNKSVWTSLKKLKKPNETFNDVILKLLQKRSKELSNSTIGAIEYGRRTGFTKLLNLGIQYEYNDIKTITNFTLDLKIKKIYYGKKTYNPTEFFGVNSNFFYINKAYLFIYFLIIIKILGDELNVKFNNKIEDLEELESLLPWRQVYYDYGLSEESFTEDIEKPLQMSEDKESIKHYQKDINKSPSINAINVIEKKLKK